MRDEKYITEYLGFNLDNQRHYSPEVQALTKEFQVVYGSFVAYGAANQGNALHRSIQCQAIWNKLAKARRKETGVSYYLTPTQYKQACK